jgi:hypothetical protein
MTTPSIWRLAVGLVGWALAASVAGAGYTTYEFMTPTGSTDTAGEPVSAMAMVTLHDGGTITVSLTNLISNQTSIGQNVSGFYITLGSTPSTASISSSSGTLRTVSSTPKYGTYTDKGSGDAGWSGKLGSILSGNTIVLDGLNGTYTPNRTLLGSPDASNLYSAGNSSVVNNDPHNPFLAGTITFDLTVAGVSSTTSISSVKFQFGTTAGDFVQGKNVPTTPEPSSLALACAGCLAIVGYGTWRRRRRVGMA